MKGSRVSDAAALAKPAAQSALRYSSSAPSVTDTKESATRHTAVNSLSHESPSLCGQRAIQPLSHYETQSRGDDAEDGEYQE